jgi:hypothetical protein
MLVQIVQAVQSPDLVRGPFKTWKDSVPDVPIVPPQFKDLTAVQSSRFNERCPRRGGEKELVVMNRRES